MPPIPYRGLAPRLAQFFLPLLLILTPVVQGAVQVSQNISSAPSAWTDSPLIASVTNPTQEATLGEDFTGGGGCTSLGQTFTIPAGQNYLLNRVDLLAGGGSGTSGSVPLSVGLYDLGAIDTTELDNYTANWCLLGNGSPVAINYTSQSTGIVRLTFTDSDQVYLRAGHVYALELSGTAGTAPVRWFRTVTDTLAKGAAYRARGWINSTSGREYGMALYATPTNLPPPATSCVIDGTILHQRIDGFGAGVAFLDGGLSPLSDAQMDFLYGTTGTQIGLNIIRVRIAPYGDWSSSLPDAQKAYARGAKILATPWTPPAAMKDNNNTVGGSLLPSQYGAFATYLNNFALYMADHQAPLAAISLQNEPDYLPTYESCLWSADQFHTFMVNNASAITAAPIMMPETFGFRFSTSDATLNDPVSAARVSYIGCHLYGATIRNYTLARSLNKPIWMTEYLINDQTQESALSTARQVSQCLSTGNMSAYVWWKLIGNANGLLDAAGNPQRRAYVFGQFSRFIRADDRRIEVATNTGTLEVTAFIRPSTNVLNIVAVNAGNEALTHQFTLSGLANRTLYPVITDATRSLARLAPVNVSDSAFTYEIPAYAVVTFSSESLDSTASAPAILEEPNCLTVKPGETITLSPTLSGFPAPTIAWFRNGSPVASDTGSLTILSASSGDEGEYTFTATNPSGSVTSNGILVGVRAASPRAEKLVNISTRGKVALDDGSLIAGFSITGEVPVQVLIRGVGKPLEGFGVLNALQDPVLVLNQIVPGPNRVIASSNDWGTQSNGAEIKAAFLSTGAFDIPDTGTDACILIWLRPGLYTATLSGAGGTEGNALLEAYSVQETTD